MWTSWGFYINEYLMGDNPVLNQVNFRRWITQAITEINRFNLEFDSYEDYEEISKVIDNILLLNNEDTENFDILDFFKYKIPDYKIDIELENNIYTLTLKLNELSAIFNFEIDGFIIINLELIHSNFNIAPNHLQKCICEYAEMLFSLNENIKGREGLDSETNFSYTWRKKNTADLNSEKEFLSNNILAKYMASSPLRRFFYFFGNNTW